MRVTMLYGIFIR